MDVNNFNRIAWMYDGLAKWVFNDAILESQQAFEAHLDQGDEILILGGGSGRMLEELPPVQSIDFLEKSKSMLQRAAKKHSPSPVAYLHEDFLEWQSLKKYDAVLCPFFLDCFGPSNLRRVIAKAKGHLKPDGRLFVSDFEQRTISRVLSRFMHLFFAATTNLESKALQNIDLEVQAQDFVPIHEKFFYQNMIFSRVYRNL